MLTNPETLRFCNVPGKIRVFTNQNQKAVK